MKSVVNSSICALLVAATGACGSTPPPQPEQPKTPQAAETAKTSDRESPPPAGPARDFRIPKPVWSDLSNGMRVASVESKTLPVVQVRVVVFAGKSADGEKTGLADLTGDMLKDGGAGTMRSRDVVTRVESLGGSLSIDTGFDKTVLSIAVTKEHLAEALEILGVLVQAPRFDQGEFGKLKKRTIDRTADAARSSGGWTASMMLYRELFTLPTDRHPYSSYGAMPADLAKLTLADVRAFHKKHFVPKNTVVVVAGDATPADVKAASQKAFGNFRGGEPPVVSFTEPTPPSKLKITLVDRPKSSQSDVYVGSLGPQRGDKGWAAFAVANQVLGGGVAGRLFLNIREKQSLAYSASSSVHELAHGPSLLVGYVGTQTAKTGLALKGLLEEMDAIATTAPSEQEVESARRYLGDVLAIRLETIGAVADELVRLRALNLPDDYNEVYRKELRDINAAYASKVASEHVRPGHQVVVVAGDANVVGPMLSHFGEVRIVDATKNFDRVRTLPMDPKAALEVPRKEGQ